MLFILEMLNSQPAFSLTLLDIDIESRQSDLYANLRRRSRISISQTSRHAKVSILLLSVRAAVSCCLTLAFYCFW